MKANNESPPPADWQEWLNKESEKAAFQVPYDGTNKFYNEDILFGFNACFNAMLPFIEVEKERGDRQMEYATKYFDENTLLRQQIEEKEKEIEGERLKVKKLSLYATESASYWKQRCEAAEAVIYEILNKSLNDEPLFIKWQQLNQQQP